MKTHLAATMLAAAAFLAATVPASAQAAPTLLQSSTSPDGLLTLTLSATNPSDSVGVDNMYIWTATNNSTSVALGGVILGSHFGDWCGGGNCFPQSPTLISVGPGCGGQSASEFPEPIAHFGVWCSPATGATLAPGASITGSVTLRPGSGGPPDYTVYSGYDDPVSGKAVFAIPRIKQANVVAAAATDIQIQGSASMVLRRPAPLSAIPITARTAASSSPIRFRRRSPTPVPSFRSPSSRC